uniref:Uncharacterized protein n=1 Tax=Anopheles farauti TaxID=69004 RepID=A0A182Q8L2_9DIPT
MEIMKPSGHHDPHGLHALHHGYDDHHHHPGTMDCGELVGSSAGGDNNNNRRSDSNNNHATASSIATSQQQQQQLGATASTGVANGSTDCDDDLSKSQLILIDDERSSLHDDDDRNINHAVERMRSGKTSDGSQQKQHTVSGERFRFGTDGPGRRSFSQKVTQNFYHQRPPPCVAHEPGHDRFGRVNRAFRLDGSLLLLLLLLPPEQMSPHSAACTSRRQTARPGSWFSFGEHTGFLMTVPAPGVGYRLAIGLTSFQPAVGLDRSEKK